MLDFLKKLLDKHRKSDGSYDVIVPGSGGKDSGYVSHLLKHKYGMNPLTVTWSPHLYTDIGSTDFLYVKNNGADSGGIATDRIGTSTQNPVNNYIHFDGFDKDYFSTLIKLNLKKMEKGLNLLNL